MTCRNTSLFAAGLIAAAVASDPALASVNAAPVARPRSAERQRVAELEHAAAARADAERAARAAVDSTPAIRVSASGDAVVSGSDSTGSYKLKLKDGQVVSVQLDGADVPLNRAVREGDTIHVLDDNGQGRFEVRLRSPDEPGGAVAVAAGPRVRIGVTLDDLPDALADHLKLPRGKGILITGVAQDGPAAKAGVEENDIVVRIDDNDNVTSDVLREVVARHNPGDTIKLRVIRKGDPRDISVSVVAAEDLASSRTWAWRTPEPPTGQGGAAGAGQGMARLQQLREVEAQRLAEMSDRLRQQVERNYGRVRAPRMPGGLTEEQAEEIRRSVVEALEAAQQAISPEVMESVQEALSEAFEEVQRSGAFNGQNFDMRLFGEPGRDPVIIVPPTPPPAAAAPTPPSAPAAPAEPAAPMMRKRSADASEERLRAMEERMRRMEELLEKIAERESRSGQR